MSEEIKYKQAKCLICEEFKILKDDICIDCDGGDEYVNKLYKFLRNLETKVIYDTNQENLVRVVQSYEKQGWIYFEPISFGNYQKYG